MNSFFRTFLASLLAFVVANILLGVFMVLIFAGVAASFAPSHTPVSSGSVLKIDMAEPVYDDPVSSPLSTIDFMSMTVQNRLALWDVLCAIERAAGDPNIEGIYINVDPYMGLGLATMGEIRDAVIEFKQSGKFVVSYADMYSQGSYYFSTAADEVYMNPEGSFMWLGMAMNTLFLKGALDKLEIEPEIIRHGEYKAAVEPFIMEKMSPENRAQMSLMLGDIWGRTVGDISEIRDIDTALLQQYATDISVTDGESALNAGLVDSLLYVSDVERIISEKMGLYEGENPSVVTLSEYIDQPLRPGRQSENKVAVIYAEGDIVDGQGEQGQVGGATVADKLAEVRQDDDVKAVVFRVNSGGGSALASETIWREMELLRQEKPVVVSMGDYAASGGYYIACPADMIIASPYTITGSIGVFGLMFNAGQSLKNKLGITVDVVKTNPSADLGRTVFGFAGVRAMTEREKEVMQGQVEKVYSTFVNHVANGRNLSFDQVDAIGGGRVWSGISASRIGLVDGYGGLKNAVITAAERAGISDDFRVTTPHKQQDSFTKIMEMISGEYVYTPQTETEKLVNEYQRLLNILSKPGIQALLPYTFYFE